jgi:hypothetical protein
MKHSHPIIILAVLSFTCLCGMAQEHTSGSATPPHPAQQSKGFFDYALGKINPRGEDYGALAGDVRDAAVRNTLDDLYFWSNIFTLFVLTGVSATLYFQLRAARKKETIIATLITQIYNGRVSDRIELDRRTTQYNTLVERHNAEVEESLLAQSRSQVAEESTSTKIKRNAEKLEKRKFGTSGMESVQQGERSPLVSGSPQLHATPPIAPQQGNVLLDHRIEAMRNTEHNLRERLNQTTFQLEQERQRNATLKGA